MLKIKFKNSIEFVDAEFSIITVNGYTVVQLVGGIPKNENGFEVFRENGDLLGDYTAFTSIYKELDKGMQFSESGLSPWVQPGPVPEPEPPTPEEIAEREKREEINALQNEINVVKQKIDATDYKIIKCYEYGSVGLDSPYGSVELHEERQMLRDRINSLEIELNTLTEV